MQSQIQEVGVSCGWKLPLSITAGESLLSSRSESGACPFLQTAALSLQRLSGGDDVTDGVTDGVASGKEEENNRNGIHGNFLFPRTTMHGAAFLHFKTFLGKSWPPAFWLEFILHYKN